MGGLAPPAPKSELPWARTLGYLETTSVTKALPRETIERVVEKDDGRPWYTLDVVPEGVP
jgi:hypothetical protein